MSTTGPVPKRDSERRRRNADIIPAEKVDIASLIQQDVEVPMVPMTTWEWAPEEDDEGNVRWVKHTLDEPKIAWEPLTVSFWDSFAKSGQAVYYEPSDWMSAYMLMEVLDRWLKPQEVKVGQIGSGRDEGAGGDVTYVFEPKILPMPGGVLSSIVKGLANLMVTEGDRRRLRLELEREALKNQGMEGTGENVVSISKTRDARFKRQQGA